MVYNPMTKITENLHSLYNEDLDKDVIFSMPGSAKCKIRKIKYTPPCEYTRNLSKEDEYTFKTTPKTYLQNFFNIKYDDLKLFEIIKSQLRKLYFDLDYEYISEEHNKEVLKALIKLLVEIFEMDFKEDDIYISYGKGKKKDTIYASYHIIINNKFKFKSVENLQSFIRILEKLIYFKEEYNILIGCVDVKPYGKNQAFKIPFQKKPDGNITQIPLNKKYELKHFLISHTEEQPNFYNIEKVIEKYNDLKYKNPMKTIITRDKEIIKVYINEELTINNYNNCFDENFELDIKEIDIYKCDKLIYFIKCIPNNKKVSFKIFDMVGKAIRTIEEIEKRKDGLKIYFEWTKQYDENITLEDLKIIYENYNIKYGYGYKTLHKLARIFNKKVEDYNEINYLFNFKPNREIETIEVNNKQLTKGIKEVNKDFVELLNKNDIIYILSPMGTGKTYGIKKYIEKEELKIIEKQSNNKSNKKVRRN